MAGSNTLESTPTSLLQSCKEGNVGLVREHLSSLSCDLLACDEDSNTALHLAAEQGHVAVVQELAGRYPTSSACKNTKGRTPLHLASARGHSPVVEALAQRFPGDLEARDEYGDTPLHLAALFGHMETVDLLCQQFHCDPSVKGLLNRIALHHACCGGHLSLVEKLIVEYKCSPVAADVNENAPIHCAAYYGHADVLFTLINMYGCSLTLKGFNATLVLHHACGGGHLSLARKLISEYGFDPMEKDDEGCTSLHCASSSGSDPLAPIGNFHATKSSHAGVVRMLLSEFGADAATCNKDGDTALNLAALNGHAEVVDVLVLEFGCSPSVKGFSGWTPLHHACCGGHLVVVEKLVSDYGCDVNARDNDGLTPLHVAAAWCGKEEVVRELITKYKCPVDCVDSNGNTPLHMAARQGHAGVVRILLSEFGADAGARIKSGDTALNLAAFNGHAEVVGVLVSKFGCSPSVKGKYGWTPLHDACNGGHLVVVKKLVSQYGCDVNARDNYGGLTPLHFAAGCGKEEVVRELTSKYKWPVDCVDSDRLAPALHQAALSGLVGVVRMLFSKFGGDAVPRNKKGDTVLNLAALREHAKVYLVVLESKFGCSPSVKGQYGRTPLHHACYDGHLAVVEKLVSEYGCDVNARDSEGLTPLHLAALCGEEEMVRELITKYKCPVDCVDSVGCTPLHWAAIKGHAGVVRMLLSVFGADAAACNKNGDTVLNLAAFNGHAEVYLVVLEFKFGCSPSVKGQYGRTPLHHACNGGHLVVVKKLVSEYGCDVNARDNDGLTPLHVAAWCGKEEVVRELITKYKCPVDCVDSNGCTPLHWAAIKGHAGVVRILVSETECDVNARDSDGRTPLYFAICNHHLSVVAELVRHNSDLTFVDGTHKKLIKSANKISKNAHTRVFVVGTPEVGKSTLIEAIKSETFFAWNVKQVPAHTAGIVPVFHESSDYGWVVFYDFAGDEEYYSSHAAILEKIMGNSLDIFLLVFDLSKLSVVGMQTAHSIYYWLRFLSYVSSSRVQVVLIGSHADVLQREGKDAEQTLGEIFTDVSQSFYSEFPDTSVEMFGYVALNCRLTKSRGLQRIKAQLKQVQKSSLSNVPQLTAGASILLGTLERDFRGIKVACQIKELSNHIELCKIYLPQEAEQLHSYLTELHGYGLVLLLECSSPREDEWVVLDLPLFLSTVHKKLFSSSVFRCEDSLSNLGVIPNARLQTMFPEFSLALLKDCLILLQYCQEINDPQIISRVLEIPEVETGLNQSFLFFPALLQTSREKVKWIRSYGSSLCCIGWCIECYRTYDFFPPRFLHVLLLRLAFTFALPKTPSELDDGAAIVDVYSRKCTLWKNGIHWLMESGVEVVVEVVKQKRAVLVMVRGSRDQEVECGDILAEVVVKVVEAKSEFCNVLKANLYIVIPNDPRQSTPPEAEQLQLFEAKHVEEVLLERCEGAVSRDGKGFLPSSDLICLQSQTVWNLLFPMGIKSLMHQLEGIVRDWYQLGMELGLATSKLEEIEVNNPGNVLRCKRLMLMEWERRPTLKPSWSSLVDALRNMNENTIADKISQQFNVDLQRRLLDPSLASSELDVDTLQQLAHATGDKWVSIASLLSFTATEIEQMRSEDQPALAMLRKLKEKGTLTHEQLRHRLKMIPLLNPTI